MLKRLKFTLAFCLIILTSSYSFACCESGVEGDYAPVGWKHHVSERWSSIFWGALLAGNMASNIVATYFQMDQASDLQNINYFDDEPGVSEENKRCGHICRENSKMMRDNAKHATNWNYLATAVSLPAVLFDFVALAIWSSMQCDWENHQEYEGNVENFSRIAFGISAVRALFNLASTSYTIDSAIYHTDEMPEETIARFQIATFTGSGYWVPMLLHGGYGMVAVGEYIETFRQVLNKAAAELPDKAPSVQIGTS
ncbi:MAG: hypothetical protein JKY15_08390 [Deltaproteobacteria bacterium]|nr:hypothetical protein [Deltaproteobacteria bacterium]